MSDESNRLAESLRDLAGEALRRQGPDAHPTPEMLTAYHAGELSAAAIERVQEHLALCRHCARLLLDLPAFLDAPSVAVADRDDAAEASWQQIQARLSQAGPRSGAAQDLPGRRRGPIPVAAAALIAAAITAGILAVPLWIIGHRLASELPPATLDLSVPEMQRGTPAVPMLAPATVHADAAATTLVLRLASPQPDLLFRVELVAREGAGTGSTGRAGHGLSTPPVTVVDARTLLLVLGRRQLPPGTYQLRVLDARQPSSEPLGEFSLQVVEP